MSSGTLLGRLLVSLRPLGRDGVGATADAGLDALPALLYGARLAASVALALWVAYLLELGNPFWAGTSAGIVCQPRLGASLRKGRFRAVGTVLGGVAIVLMMAALPQSRVGLLAALTLWCAACGFASTILRTFARYAAALSGYTAAIVFADAVDAPGQAFILAATRCTEICIGIMSAGVVLLLTDVGGARRRLARMMTGAVAQVLQGFATTLARGVEAAGDREARREVIRRVAVLDPVIDEAIGEAADLRRRVSLLQAGTAGLFSALSAWRGAAVHLDDAGADAAARRHALALRDVLARIDTVELARAPHQAAMACLAGTRAVLAMRPATVSDRLLSDAVTEALLGLRRALGVAAVALRTRAAPPGLAGWRAQAPRFQVPDVLPALVDAIRIILVMVATLLVWVETAWPGGQTMVLFAAISTILFSPRGDAAYAASFGYALGTLATTAAAAVVSFAVLPAVHGFARLAWVLAVILVPLGALSVGRWQGPILTGMVMNFTPILAPANQPSFDPGAFFNSALGISAGTFAAVVAMRIVPPLSPALRSGRLRALSLRDLQRLAMARRVPSIAHWTARLAARLDAMPATASPEERGELVAILSVGEAVIRLRCQVNALGRAEVLAPALRALADACPQAAWHGLGGFCAALPPGTAGRVGLRVLRARVAAAVIVDATRRHEALFSSRIRKGHACATRS